VNQVNIGGAYPPQACVVDEQGNSATLYRIPEVHENGYWGLYQFGIGPELAHLIQFPLFWEYN